MRRNFTKTIMAMAALSMAGLAGSGQVASAKTLATAANTVEYKATNDRKAKKEKISVNHVTGGLDFDHGKPFGLTPKEYGMRYGNGGSKRSNRLRYSHNAKVKRRKG
jgi:hypothetical protein